MNPNTDHDGKSKTASAVDARHYPEQHEVNVEPDVEASQEEIAALAYEIWLGRGCPIGSPEEDWVEASEKLRAKTNSSNALKSTSASVQR